MSSCELITIVLELHKILIWSSGNECIEFWFLLHFAYYTANNHRAEYIMFLNDKFKELGITNTIEHKNKTR